MGCCASEAMARAGMPSEGQPDPGKLAEALIGPKWLELAPRPLTGRG